MIVGQTVRTELRFCTSFSHDRSLQHQNSETLVYKFAMVFFLSSCIMPLILCTKRLLKFLGVLTVEAFAASALGMLIGCVAKDGDAAMAIGPPVMTVFILFSGEWTNELNKNGSRRLHGTTRCMW